MLFQGDAIFCLGNNENFAFGEIKENSVFCSFFICSISSGTINLMFWGTWLCWHGKHSKTKLITFLGVKETKSCQTLLMLILKWFLALTVWLVINSLPLPLFIILFFLKIHWGYLYFDLLFLKIISWQPHHTWVDYTVWY